MPAVFPAPRTFSPTFVLLTAVRYRELNGTLKNPEEPKVVRVELLDGRKRHFTLDTEESAIGWRNDLEAALFSQSSRTLPSCAR